MSTITLTFQNLIKAEIIGREADYIEFALEDDTLCYLTPEESQRLMDGENLTITI